ncbi:hypothetical protein D3C71_1188280 [compost metagenome]
MIENGLLGCGKIGIGQGHCRVGLVVPGLIGRCSGCGHYGRVSGPQHCTGINRAARGETIGLDRAPPVLGVVTGLEVTGAAGENRSACGAAAAGTCLGRDFTQSRRQRGVQPGAVGGLVVLALTVTRGVRQHLVRRGKTHGVGVHVLLRKIGGIPAFARKVGAGRAHIDVEGEFGDVIQIKCIAFFVPFFRSISIVVNTVPIG